MHLCSCAIWEWGSRFSCSGKTLMLKVFIQNDGRMFFLPSNKPKRVSFEDLYLKHSKIHFCYCLGLCKLLLVQSLWPSLLC